MKIKFQTLILIMVVLSFSCKGKKAEEGRSKIYLPSNETVAPEFSLPIKNTDIQIEQNINPSLSRKGKSIYQNKCKICHYLNTDKLTGPGFKNITRR